jgi:hypothetical protein
MIFKNINLAGIRCLSFWGIVEGAVLGFELRVS